MNRRYKALLMLVLAMVIYGTIGIFRRMIPLSSGVIAFSRGIIGSVFLLLLNQGKGKRLSFAIGRRPILGLILSGALMGFNWILLFEAYNYTSVATATLCYYMQPVIVILASAVLFREKLTLQRGICAFAALVGMVLVSGLPEQGIPEPGELRGILLGLGAAVLYASVVLLNKSITGVGTYEKTIVQLLSSAAVLILYLILTENLPALRFTAGTLGLLLLLGVLHTGVAYALYFGSLEDLPAQTAAILGYIDPVTAVLLSLLLLREPMTALSALGAVLILGAAAVSEWKRPSHLESEGIQREER